VPNIWNGNLERSGFRVLLLFLLLWQLLLLWPLLLLLLLLLLGKGQLSIILASIAAVKVSNNLKILNVVKCCKMNMIHLVMLLCC